jgi:EAL domain-containing protein (putative c-di-GMP-specific phosphodiesterase class I)
VHVVASLREALAADRFRLYAQPILPLAIGPCEPRFEILLRLQSESGEVLPPSKFLPAAERYQLIGEIDRWVVANACRVLGSNRTVLDRRAARFSINLSGQSITDLQMADYIAAQLHAARVPPDLVCFELTETAAVANLEKADAFMQRVRALGCTFALDDFGTGTSSLAHLKNLPVSMLKIDGSFVRDALTSPRSDSLVKAVAQLARAMGITTVAEYVETGRAAGADGEPRRRLRPRLRDRQAAAAARGAAGPGAVRDAGRRDAGRRRTGRCGAERARRPGRDPAARRLTGRASDGARRIGRARRGANSVRPAGRLRRSRDSLRICDVLRILRILR